jgi:hypothetical protein
MAKSSKICAFPNCEQVVLARNFCRFHYHQFRTACIENGSWQKQDEEIDAAIQREKWTYEGDEQSLIDALAAKEKQHGA